MRILLDLQACQASSMHRGIGRYSMALALAMARNSGGHELRIVLNEDYPDSVAAIRKAFDGLVPQSHIGTFVTPVPAGEVDPRNAWRVHTAERIRMHYLAGMRPDVVHVASLFEGLGDNVVASVPPGGTGFDTAVTLYDLIPLMRKERYLVDPNMSAWYYRKLESMKRAELLLAISASARQEGIDLLELPPERVVNISSAVDAIFRPRALAPEARATLLAGFGLKRDFIMYTGGIDYRKNIEGLIEAYAKLPGQLRRQYQLAVVCSIRDPDRFRLERLAAKCGLAKDDLVLTGFVSDDDLVSLYNCTSLFVFPSLHEGFGLPALEAMACGAPVIGSNTSSIPEVIGRADAMFDPASVEAITAAMAQVLLDPARQDALRAHGLVQATRFSWDASARRAIESFEEVHRRRAASGTVSTPVAAPVRKPRLAYVSPLPPTRSGIAAYSADLLPELARFYDIELVLAQENVEGTALDARFPQRTVDWFDANVHLFDHIVYQFGNSAFHTHMFGLLERHPGVVVLHDFFLSGVIHHAETDHVLPNHYCRSLYFAHGYHALAEEKLAGRTESVMAYPSNKQVLDRATGVIVHSHHAVALANRWYGEGYASEWRVLPLVCLRRDPDKEAGKSAARLALGLAADDFVVCSFGILSAPKCNDRLVEAWIDSSLARDPRCHLVFVGDLAPGRFGIALRDRIAAHPRIRVTGYASSELYRGYLAAADVAVQLRGSSRGETSGAVFDCLSYGLPTILNAHGSAAEVPEDVCLRLEDDFTQEALRTALERMHEDASLRMHLSEAASVHMAKVHAPSRAAGLYRDAIADFARGSLRQAEQALIAEIAASSAEAHDADLLQTAAAIATNRPRSGARQVLVDIEDLEAWGPARLAELNSLIAQAPRGWRIEPVRYDGSRYRYARRFTLDLIGRPDLQIEDGVVQAYPEDVWLMTSDSGGPPPKWLARGMLSLSLGSHDPAGSDLAQRLAAALASVGVG
jgi:glycosyltransferase involved in cell wall biosynthesis